MATKLVEMAISDPKNAKNFVTEMQEVEIVAAKIRLRETRSGGRRYNSVISGRPSSDPARTRPSRYPRRRLA